MKVIYKTPYHRIEEPLTGLAVRFTCKPAPISSAPHVRARLIRPDRCTPFATFDQAAACFAKYLQGQPLDIVRVDA